MLITRSRKQAKSLGKSTSCRIRSKFGLLEILLRFEDGGFTVDGQGRAGPVVDWQKEAKERSGKFNIAGARA